MFIGLDSFWWALSALTLVITPYRSVELLACVESRLLRPGPALLKSYVMTSGSGDEQITGHSHSLFMPLAP